MKLRIVHCAAAMLIGVTVAAQSKVDILVPKVDHHQHLLSPTLAAALSKPEPPPIELPPELRRRFGDELPRFDDAKAIAEFYAEDAILIFSAGGSPEEVWVRGRQGIGDYLSKAFRRQYSLTPVAYGIDGTSGYMVGYLSGLARHFNFLMSLKKDANGTWKIAAQSMMLQTFATPQPLTADDLIKYLDAAGIRRALVLSLAYIHGMPSLRGDDEYVQVKRENDWTSQQVAKYPDRLRAFCSFNPLRDYALAELDRCAKDPNLHYGLKLHLANSQVNLRNAEHVKRLKEVFRAANERRMPIVIHLWTGVGYGRADAQAFLNEVLPVAPDIPIQIAHLAGAGPGPDPGAQEALGVFADAVSVGDPRTRNLLFDVTTNVNLLTSVEEAQFIAARIRQIGLNRILYGSDMAALGNLTPHQGWGAFRAMLPLTESEFSTIANNVAPYMR